MHARVLCQQYINMLLGAKQKCLLVTQVSSMRPVERPLTPFVLCAWAQRSALSAQLYFTRDMNWQGINELIHFHVLQVVRRVVSRRIMQISLAYMQALSCGNMCVLCGWEMAWHGMQCVHEKDMNITFYVVTGTSRECLCVFGCAHISYTYMYICIWNMRICMYICVLCGVIVGWLCSSWTMWHETLNFYFIVLLRFKWSLLVFYSRVKRKCDIDDLAVNWRRMLDLFSNENYYLMLN